MEAKELPRLNESPSEKEGKYVTGNGNLALGHNASMKALPKRKGNFVFGHHEAGRECLNESPSEKEGKYCSQSI